MKKCLEVRVVDLPDMLEGLATVLGKLLKEGKVFKELGGHAAVGRESQRMHMALLSMVTLDDLCHDPARMHIIWLVDLLQLSEEKKLDRKLCLTDEGIRTLIEKANGWAQSLREVMTPSKQSQWQKPTGKQLRHISRNFQHNIIPVEFRHRTKKILRRRSLMLGQNRR